MSSLASEERRTWLLAQLRSAKRVSLADAAAELGVSEMTVRRDLDSMEESGIARRVRGGAVYSGPVSFEERDRSYIDEKQRIAERLLPFVPQRGFIAIDSSTTMYRLAQLIADRDELIVVTNGLLTFQVLRDKPGVSVILTGGTADQRSDSLVGPVATRCVEAMRFGGFFASAAAMDVDASYEDTLEEAEVKRAFARCSARTFIGAHSAKLNENAASEAVLLGDVSVLATELLPDDTRLDDYRRLIHDIR